jgi:hypothetical protein
MSVVHNKFENPATGETYTWLRNHSPDGEQDAGKARPITRVNNTSGHLAAIQQGDDGNYVLRLAGKLTVRSQWRAFWHWYALCETQTIYFTDFDGQKYEGTISSLTGKRVGKLSDGIGADASMRLFKIEYTLEFTVVKFLEGDLFDMGVVA